MRPTKQDGVPPPESTIATSDSSVVHARHDGDSSDANTDAKNDGPLRAALRRLADWRRVCGYAT